MPTFLVPDSWGSPLREFNPCHSPKDGQFVSKGQGRCAFIEHPGAAVEELHPAEARKLDRAVVKAVPGFTERNPYGLSATSNTVMANYVGEDDRRAAKALVAHNLGVRLKEMMTAEPGVRTGRAAAQVAKAFGEFEEKYKRAIDEFVAEVTPYSEKAMRTSFEGFLIQKADDISRQTKAAVFSKWTTTLNDARLKLFREQFPEHLERVSEQQIINKLAQNYGYETHEEVRQAGSLKAWIAKQPELSQGYIDNIVHRYPPSAVDWADVQQQLAKHPITGAAATALDALEKKLFAKHGTRDEAQLRAVKAGTAAADRYMAATKGSERAFQKYLKQQGVTLQENPPRESAVAGFLISQWAKTSSDKSRLSMAIQKAAMDEFGLTDAKDPFHRATHAGHRSKAEDTYGSFAPVLRAFVRAQYDETQAFLKKSGIDYVTVYRGIRVPPNEAKEFRFRERQRTDKAGNRLVSRRSNEWGENAPLVKRTGGRVVDAVLQPISSFATSFEQARSFAAMTDNRRPNYKGVVMGIRVPASKVLSTAVTGFGCLNEAEVTVLGGVHHNAFAALATGGVFLSQENFHELHKNARHQRAQRAPRAVNVKAMRREAVDAWVKGGADPGIAKRMVQVYGAAQSMRALKMLRPGGKITPKFLSQMMTMQGVRAHGPSLASILKIANDYVDK